MRLTELTELIRALTELARVTAPPRVEVVQPRDMAEFANGITDFAYGAAAQQRQSATETEIRGRGNAEFCDWPNEHTHSSCTKGPEDRCTMHSKCPH
jgi:hypothetical protein